MSREEKVRTFVLAAGKKPHTRTECDLDQSILACITEEMEEFKSAAYAYHVYPNEENRAELCKEWADLQYVVSQAVWYFDIPADPAFNRVHQNNLTKIPEDGIILRRADGKILKPEGYQKVDMRGL